MLRILLSGMLYEHKQLINLPVHKRYSTIAVTSMLGKKKKLGKMGAVMEKKVLPVETDAHKLVNYVCGSNILKEGEDIRIKPDSDYPEWLWKLNTGKPKRLEEMDPNTKEYWIKVRKMAIVQEHKLKKLRKW
ncbi:mitochondrial ribosomal protein L54 [Rhodnius prolixus]|uniref:Large ribosomal subunit protein mL54 n=1 Tax=Rhodnius prolixus TaxID=13249 RepID=T1I3F4_RHOPR